MQKSQRRSTARRSGGLLFQSSPQSLKKDDDDERDTTLDTSEETFIDSLDPSAINPIAPMSGIKRKNVKKSGSTANFVLTFIFLTGVVVGGFFYLQSWQSHQQVKIRRQIEENQVIPLSRQWEEQQVELKEAKEKLTKLEDEIKKKENNPEHDKLKKRSAYLEKYRTRMHDAIQHLSKIAVLEKFGPGPHFVEIKLAIDPESNIYDPAKDGTPGGDDDEHKIVIEMAAVDDMPHSVHLFLEQVDRGLHNGCSFHRNAGHVIQGGAAPNFLTPKDFHLQARFKQSGFESVLFQEYSAHHPHVKYSLGFAGRPGGPDWYVSTMDNSKIHGPGGQDSYEDPTEADPCFAKVISGFDLIDRIGKSAVAPGGYRRMKNYVAIVSMKILKEKPGEKKEEVAAEADAGAANADAGEAGGDADSEEADGNVEAPEAGADPHAGAGTGEDTSE